MPWNKISALLFDSGKGEKDLIYFKPVISLQSLLVLLSEPRRKAFLKVGGCGTREVRLATVGYI